MSTENRTRRDFVKLSAAGALAAGFSSAAIRRALALPADHGTGTIQDVQHIVVLMQENRSFDHYFGTLRGVRGHHDRFPVPQADGRPVWFQPRAENPAQPILPFHLNTKRTGAQAVTSLDHSWTKTHGAFVGGLYNAWPENKTNMTMGHFTRQDIPFHFELADAFTICDHYFCSVPGPTDPNRMYLMTGTINPTGVGGGPLVNNADNVNADQVPLFHWTTYPERLEAAGISWQVYQQGLDWEDPYNGNYGLNMLQNFQQFIAAPAGSSLQRRGHAVRTLGQFATDVQDGALPQVSWLMPPAAFSEHPQYMPADGASYIAQVLETLTANPAVWSKTVLLVMYDENDGFFDHMVPPQPPTPVLPGISTVSTAGEIHDVVNHIDRPVIPADQLPYGLGPRVPMLVISPWSKGGHVCSQVFDHTSVIRFIEARFGVMEPNISPWRRAVSGDLTTAFDFTRPDPLAPQLPNTAIYRASAVHEVQTLPKAEPPEAGQDAGLMGQEPGLRPARPLPYAFAAEMRMQDGVLALHLVNTGGQGAGFYLYERGSAAIPRRYTVGAGDHISDTVPVSGGAAEFALYGPNGFYRGVAGRAGGPADLTVAAAQAPGGVLQLVMTNHGEADGTVTLRDNAYGRGAHELTVPAGQVITQAWTLAASHHWYDVTVQTSSCAWRFAGHLETGAPSYSDPAAHSPHLETVATV